MTQRIRVKAVLLGVSNDTPPPPPSGFSWVSDDAAIVLQPDPTGETCVANIDGATHAVISVKNNATSEVSSGTLTYDADTGILTFSPA